VAPPSDGRSSDGIGSGDEPAGADDRRARGREAEDLAAAFLEERGCEVIARNHRIRHGEVDLVCREGDVLCFVEVRSRTSAAQGGPEETVGPSKARRVVAAATDWAMRNGGLERAVRFDVIAVTFGDGAPRVEHFPAAFDASGRPGVW
jgi:putative endonuclease